MTNEATTQPEFKDYLFMQDDGVVHVDGKSHWPACVRVHIKRKRALDAALRLLNALKDDQGGEYIELTLFGSVEEIPTEDDK
ncbi:hypothetical protein O9X98_07165 [Agrobacterium salinitolerans]|nr:hypothetical protein [Agrobacterium salinitolerans]